MRNRWKRDSAVFAGIVSVMCGCSGYAPRPAGFQHMNAVPSAAAKAPVAASEARAADAVSSAPEPTPAPVRASAQDTIGMDPANPRPPNLNKMAGGAMTIEGFEPVHFDHDSAVLPVPALRAIRNCADYLAKNPQVWVILEGNCDHDGSNEYNYNLGMNRATAVRHELIAAGTEAERLFLISYGEERPAIEEKSEADKGLNRRVDFRAFLAPDTVVISGSAEASAAPPENVVVPTPMPEGEEMP